VPTEDHDLRDPIFRTQGILSADTKELIGNRKKRVSTRIDEHPLAGLRRGGYLMQSFGTRLPPNDYPDGQYYVERSLGSLSH
jgi:hypothetical protein